MGLADEAVEDLSKALELEPDNKAVKVELTKAKKAILESKKKAKAVYGNMFSKISIYNEKEIPFIPGLSANNPKVI